MTTMPYWTLLFAQSQFYSELPLNDLLKVKECKAEVLEPQNSNQEDVTKFVSSLALSVHVEASLTNVEDSSNLAIQVRVSPHIMVRPPHSGII